MSPLSRSSLCSLLLVVLLWETPIPSNAADAGSSSSSSSSSCDSNAYPAESTKASHLQPNAFHKVCPSTSSLGPPICGDGSPFSFYYTSPIRRRSSNKILIEFLGGGACWDADTCEYNALRLTFPYDLDNYVGLSCSEIQAGIEQNGNDNKANYDQDVPVNMLCAQQFDDRLDLREYHTIIVPYCTQDTYMGDNSITYDDGTLVHHRGARNLLSVLEWVYQNFPHPDHIVLTGCSAGGTALPIAYDLVHHHYNTFVNGGGRKHHRPQTPVSTLMDSPVYLTPSYFLEYGLPHWNVQPIMQKARFNYNKYGHSEDYSSRVVSHILKRGSKRDPFGFITHNSDPVSLAYFQRMSKSYADDDDNHNNNNNNNDDDGNNNNNDDDGNNNNDDDGGYNNNDDNNDDANNRFLEDEEEATEEEWWSELSTSIAAVTSKHKNTDTYVIDGEGHCSFGLYYAQLEGGDDFRAWASNLLYVPNSTGPSSGRGWFLFSVLIGFSIIGASMYRQRQLQQQQKRTISTQESYEEDDFRGMSSLDNNTNTNNNHHKDNTNANNHNNSGASSDDSSNSGDHSTLKQKMKQSLQRSIILVAYYTRDAPVTIGYGVALTIYFVRMMTWDGLESVLYNPSVGPTATTLSAFGINNPTLAVYHHQILRVLITSTFLCSGVITYLMVVLSLYRYIRPLEQVMQLMSPSPSIVDPDDDGTFSSRHFLEVAGLLSLGSNLFYACVANGASCSTIAVVLGLQAFSCTMHSYHKQPAFPRPLAATIFMFLITCLFLPFNSWIMMMAAMVLGVGLALRVYIPSDAMLDSSDHYSSYSEQNESGRQNISSKDNPLANPPPQPISAINGTVKRNNRLAQGLLAVFAVQLFLLAVRIRRPKRMYEHPFVTGCELVYTTKVDDIVNSYVGDQFGGGNDNDNKDRNRQFRWRRFLGEENEDADDDAAGQGDEEFMCAQFCVPHLVSKPFMWGARMKTSFDVQPGWCEDVGYSQHIADKTFAYKSYSIDIELYYDDSYNSGEDGGK